MRTTDEIELFLQGVGIPHVLIDKDFGLGFIVSGLDADDNIYPIGSYSSLYQMDASIESDALKAKINYPMIVVESKRLTNVEYALKLKEMYSDRWTHEVYDDRYWLCRLMQEVGEAASVIAGDHEDSLEFELAQIASIALNWLQLLEARMKQTAVD